MKRKRQPVSDVGAEKAQHEAKKAKVPQEAFPLVGSSPLSIQIIAGSYDRALHGVTATIEPEGGAQFADTFLFNAHASAIRCLALSPPSAAVPGQGQKVMLATGSTDERINIYSLSAHPPRRTADQDLLSSVATRRIAESSKNRELGTLLHHSSTVTKLAFPTRSKLLSASEDSTIAITRTRDWSLLSSIKAPIPNVLGRPSGDTAPMGGTPSGVNDFAIHPSMKVMISVSKGERCMRLWNLVTGKKAGVLNFSRDMLQDAGEGKHSTGEGRKVVWGSSAGEDEFAVGFDRNVVVFGMDSRPKCKVMPDARNKVHEFCYIKLAEGDGGDTVLAVSTEDGRIMFFSTKTDDLVSQAEPGAAANGKTAPPPPPLPTAKLISQLGGKAAGVSGRIKDFSILPLIEEDGTRSWLVVSGTSDGNLMVWKLTADDLTPAESKQKQGSRQVGQLLGSYETQNRITCVQAFVMIPRPQGVEESEDELDEDSEDDGSEERDDDE